MKIQNLFYVIVKPYLHGYSLSVGVKHYLKKGQPRVTQLQCGINTIDILKLLHSFFDFILTRQVTFTDDLTDAEKLECFQNF